VDRAVWDSEERAIGELKAWLVEAGFSAQRLDYPPAFVGDEVTDFARPPVSIRLVRDRSVWSIEVAGPDGTFVGIQLWRDLLDGTGPSIEAAPIQDRAKSLKARLDEIEHLASAPDFSETAAALHELGRRRARLRFPGAFPE
jgi:hypothetical protein